MLVAAVAVLVAAVAVLVAAVAALVAAVEVVVAVLVAAVTFVAMLGAAVVVVLGVTYSCSSVSIRICGSCNGGGCVSCSCGVDISSVGDMNEWHQ